MKTKYSAMLTLSTVIALTALSSSPALANILDKDDFTPAQLASIKVTMSDAIAKAQAAQTGTPIKVEMENEHKGIVYEVELLNNDKEKKVKINAVTGEIISGGGK